VTNRPIKIGGSAQAPALGSAMFGALAAGKERGGFGTIGEAVAVMAKVKDVLYTPNTENAAVYDKLYAEYKILHDYFGRGANDVMKRLKNIKKESNAGAACGE
jgi:L-ribulokinase